MNLRKTKKLSKRRYIGGKGFKKKKPKKKPKKKQPKKKPTKKQPRIPRISVRSIVSGLPRLSFRKKKPQMLRMTPMKRMKPKYYSKSMSSASMYSNRDNQETISRSTDVIEDDQGQKRYWNKKQANTHVGATGQPPINLGSISDATNVYESIPSPI